MAQIPTPEQLMTLPPEFLAEDTSRILFNVTISFTAVTTLVYISFLASRAFCAERNNLEIWILPVLSYIFCVGLWALSFRTLSQSYPISRLGEVRPRTFLLTSI